MSKEELVPNELTEEMQQNNGDIEERKEKVKRDTILIIILLIILLLVVTFTIGMGVAFVGIRENSQRRIPIEVVKSEILEVKYTENDFFNLTDERILSDELGVKTKPLKFNLTNTGNTKLHYKIKLIPLNTNFKTEEIIPSSAIRYKLVQEDNNSGIKTFSDATNDALYIGEIDSKESLDYKLHIWLDENSNVNLNNKSYLFKIQIEAGK